jgi:hypothetical protein
MSRKPNNKSQKSIRSFVCKFCHATVQASRSGPGAPWILRQHTITTPIIWRGDVISKSLCRGSNERP